MKSKLFIIFILFAPTAWSQCAPGIPSAGNPGCIPPNQMNSPYYQGAASAPAQPEAVWADRWGAIALDPHSGIAGLTEHKPSKSWATSDALSECAARGGIKCEIVLAYHNQCAAVAQRTDGGPIQAAGSPELDDAKARALEACGGSSQCKIMYSSCSFAERAN
jgi:hypothetical protein